MEELIIQILISEAKPLKPNDLIALTLFEHEAVIPVIREMILDGKLNLSLDWKLVLV